MTPAIPRRFEMLVCAQHALAVWLGLIAIGLSAHGEAPGNPPSATLAPPDVQDLLLLGPLRPLFIRLHITIDRAPFREVWRQRFDEGFADQDTDRNGRVTADEATLIERHMNGALRDNARADFKSLADADGQIDRAKLLAEIEKRLPPFSVRRRAVIAQGSALALFPLLDTDHNQQLSADELAVAETRLSERDFDDDHTITPAELILDPNAIAAASDPNSAQSDLGSDEGPVMPILTATTTDQIVNRLLAHYDRNRDGRLTTTAPAIEIKLAPSVMGALDRDGDRALDRAELASFLARSADLELTFAMGRATANQRRRQTPTNDPEIRIRKTLLDGYAIDMGEAHIAFKFNNRDPQQADLASLRTYDRDNNGYIDAAEAAANNLGKAAFAAMDADGDGKVFKGEFSSFMTRQNAAAAVRLQLEVKDLGQDLFAVLDTDLDGVLSPRELRSARDILNVEDKNGDGLLAGDEVPQRIELELARGVDERAETDARMARNRPMRSTAKAATAGPLWFRKMDRNNDGDLSPHEFMGPPAEFQKIDVNHDGLIDREEAESVAKK